MNGKPDKTVRSKPTLVEVDGETIKDISMNSRNIVAITEEGRILINSDLQT